MNLDKGIFQSQSCPVCGTTATRMLFAVRHRGSDVLQSVGRAISEEPSHVCECISCSHNYLNPIVNESYMKRYYSETNSEFYHRKPEPNPDTYNQKEYIRYVEIVRRLISKGKILEIGCGRGVLLKRIRDAGYECFGLDPSPLAAGYAREELGLDVEAVFLEQSTYSSMKFDLVVLVDVLEHVVDAKAFIESLVRVLNPGGYIFIATGNASSLTARLAKSHWGYYLSWEHVSFFSPRSLSYLLDCAGFSEVHIAKTSLQNRPVQNVFEFAKNLVKLALNSLCGKQYTHGLCYDHMVVSARRTM